MVKKKRGKDVMVMETEVEGQVQRRKKKGVTELEEEEKRIKH